METQPATKSRNRTVRIAVPKSTTLKYVFACDYPWATGQQTERVVSAEDAEILNAEQYAKIKDPFSGKVTEMQRFTCVVINETDNPVAAKNRHIGTAKLDFVKNPLAEQTIALKDGIAALVTQMSELVAMNKTLTQRPANAR